MSDLFIDTSVKEFTFELSSKKPVPGGGGAAALAGALGAALGGMVANLTLGKEKYADVEEDIQNLKISAYRIQKELLDCIQADAEAFAPLAGAYRLPRETEEERATKARIMEAALKDAVAVPLDIMRKTGESIELLREFADKGSKLAVSDAACGAILSKAAMQSAWMNVCINTDIMKDREYAEKIDAEGKALLEKYLPFADAIYSDVEETLTRKQNG